MMTRRTILGAGGALIAATGAEAFAGAPAVDAAPLMPARLRRPGPARAAGAAPVRIHHPDAHAVLADGRLLTLYDRASWSEGAVWWPRERTLVWSDIVGRRVLGWREDGAVDVLRDATPFINGNAVAPDGVAHRIVDMVQPNGLAFSPDGRIFYASQTPEHGEGEVAIFAFDRDGARLTDRRRFATVPEGIPDGFTVDRRGWIWSSSARGVEVFDAAARHLATVPTPHLCSNCTFDGDQRRLFVTGKGMLWMLPLDTP